MDEPKRHVGDVNAGFFKQGLRLAADIFERRKGSGRAVAPYKDFVFPRGLALLLIELHKSGLAVRGFLYRCRGRVFGEEVLTRILFCRLFKQLSVEPRIKHLKRRVLLNFHKQFIRRRRKHFNGRGLRILETDEVAPFSRIQQERRPFPQFLFTNIHCFLPRNAFQSFCPLCLLFSTKSRRACSCGLCRILADWRG